jgi:hypothetical protein
MGGSILAGKGLGGDHTCNHDGSALESRASDN